ncbi:AAA family ATPase [Buttiauxella agrestis]|uniref:DNA repair ATPase n=1 Tax=Buttiauxella agrestis ATCC 33320 TaxID=1006004 RepID=A0A085GA26_9ENTR|nr:AAA family ATPase [Buttiauxella agrestis]KFC80571.1 DNA repair ATPase [Buttiauxella agrestis ATCC 33320]
MELRLKNITSYQKDTVTTINLSKKINILYGHNGSGKSTISNFFYNTAHADFQDCECSSLENFRPVVYNSKFIEDNFYNTKEQKGVFTLSKANADIEKEIAEKEILKESLTNQYREKINSAKNLTEEKNKEELKIQDSIWTKTESTRLSDLKLLMRGSLGSKRDFFTQTAKIPRLPNINLSLLAKEYSELLKHKNNELLLITPFLNYTFSADDIHVLVTPIIDSSNSYLSEAIKKIQNLDWVKRGKELYLNGTTCPFCQENTITPIFHKAIESIFDESYEQKVRQISSIKSAYEAATKNIYSRLQQEISACEIIPFEEKEKSTAHLKILEAEANKNLALISEKIKNPSSVVTLQWDNSTASKLQESITEYNKKINEINIKVRTFKTSENSIRGRIWGGIRDLCNPEFETLSELEKSHNENYKKIKLETDEITKQGKKNNEEIKALRDQVSNIDLTIDSINLRLKNLGIHGFNITKHNESEDKYIISRTDKPENENVYRSLSEGEKTLITFLYFLECCKGKLNKDDVDMRDTFIIIDDPISSLSQNYIYDIASIIHFEIIKSDSAKKILLLTHNLYFFHELIKLAPKSKEDKTFKRDYYLGRVTKNQYSIISDIEKNSIQNEYQSLWQILKDAKAGKVNRIIIPNIMRNILEYYFAFVHRTDALQSELIKLANDDGNNDFRAFYRYINRGSHSDAVNITDMGDIAPEKYMEQLRIIFTMTGDEKHYIKMMDEEEEEVATA